MRPEDINHSNTEEILWFSWQLLVSKTAKSFFLSSCIRQKSVVDVFIFYIAANLPHKNAALKTKGLVVSQHLFSYCIINIVFYCQAKKAVFYGCNNMHFVFWYLGFCHLLAGTLKRLSSLTISLRSRLRGAAAATATAAAAADVTGVKHWLV